MFGEKRSFNYLALLLTVALFCVSGAAWAQTGSITGQVFDPAGAVIVNATVTAVSDRTSAESTVKTSSAGLYSFPALAPATYKVTVSAPGFADQQKNVLVTIAGTVPANFKLQVSGATSTIEVQNVAQSPVETDSFQLSTVVDSKQINELPLILRDPYQLVLLSPGAVSTPNNDGGFSVNGQRDRNNNFLLDGVDNNDTSVPGIPGGIASANPSSTQEFRVITNNYDAEFGRNTGAVVDVVTKGGGSSFHGDAYEFGRWNALGARDFFNTKANGKQDPYIRNDFGASVGGPLWKEHTFFFLNGEVQRFRTTRTESQTTPTAAFKSGVFTFIDPSDGSTHPVDLTRLNPNNASGLLFDPKMKALLNQIPTGQVDNGDGVSTTYFYASPDNLNQYNLTGRFDHRLSRKHQLMVRYNYGHYNDSDPFHDEVLPGYGNSSSISTNHSGTISVTSALSASVANKLSGGYNLANSGFFCNHAAIDKLTGTDNFGNGIDISIPYFFTLGCSSLGDSNSQARLSSTLSFLDTLDVVKGRHDMKFGGDYRRVSDNSTSNFSSRDLLSLDEYDDSAAPAWTYANTNSSSYIPFQNLIWAAQGAVANEDEAQFFTRQGTRRGNDYARYRQHEWDVFAQDTYKVSPRLTAILGIRYAFNGVPYETNGNLSNFYGNSSAPLPAVGYFTFRSVGPGTGHQLYMDSYGMVEPRVGFSLDPFGDGRTAVRGGFGIFHDRIFDNLFGNLRANPPFQSTLNDYPFDPTAPATAGTTVASYAPPGNLTPSANITDGDFYEPVTIDANLKMPTNYGWNVGVQRQINRALAFEANYVGNHSLHALREIDLAPPQPALVQAYLRAHPTAAASLQSTALYTTYPTVNNTAFYHNLFQTSIASGNYNALQLKVTGHTGGLTLLASYSYAHALDNASDPIVPGAGGSGLPRNSFDLGPEYGNADSDVRHRGTVSAVYELPIGTGKSLLNSGVIGHIFEGIELSGIEQAQTGQPMELRGTRDNLHTSVVNRPQLVGNPYPSGRGTIVAAGVITGPRAAAFANPAFDQNVSIHRNKFMGPGLVNTDVMFQKTQAIHEQVKLVFRAESYNALNHPNFQPPPVASLRISSSTFGVSQSQLGQNDGTTGARQIQGALKVIF